MTEKKQAPCGSWASPITSELIASATVRLSEPRIDANAIWWLESRPYESGRTVLVRRHTAAGTTQDVTPPPFNVRTLAHEYGGGAYTIHNGTAYFVNYADQRIYKTGGNGGTLPVTNEGPYHYADLVVDAARGRLICIREDHSRPGEEARSAIVAISLQSGETSVLVEGNDFYSSPTLSNDSKSLSWLTWHHPNMPWDESEVWLAELDARGEVKDSRQIAGGRDESCFQPQFSPEGHLFFLSDRSGWWNIHRAGDTPQAVLSRQAEFAAPQWVFGLSTYAFSGPDEIVTALAENGRWSLGKLSPAEGKIALIDLPWQDFSYVRAHSDKIVTVAASPTEMASVLLIDLSGNQATVLRRSSEARIDPGYIARAEAIEFPTENGKTAHAFFYPPTNKDFRPMEGELPPLLVKSHGGPTSACSSSLSLAIQYWTSRGFAVVDVNYGGSSGFGRQYRNRLYNSWGITDVDDCVNAALFLSDQGRVDPRRMAISGGSAGGYTTLCALAFRNVFAAGASYYGVSDLSALARDTHKFESRYLDRLVGPYPEKRSLYEERSPLVHAGRISCPVLFLQGLEDKVVPPSQSEAMVEALRDKGVPVAYITFEGEQHGFRQAENIKKALDAELFFYSQIFHFETADPITPISIENWGAAARR